jgi:carbonic anhydrase
MSVLEQVLAINRAFVENNNCKDASGRFINVSKLPRKRLAIFTCMDTRLVDFLEPAMGIRREDAVVIKNAGNSVTGSFEATIRSLVVAVFELGVTEIMIIGHEDCGVAHSSAKTLIEKMLKRGISSDAIKMVKNELEVWLDNFRCPHDNVREVVEKIRNNPLIPTDVPIHGLIFEPFSGEISLVVNGYGNEVEQPVDHIRPTVPIEFYLI